MTVYGLLRTLTLRSRGPVCGYLRIPGLEFRTGYELLRARRFALLGRLQISPLCPHLRPVLTADFSPANTLSFVPNP